MNTALTVAGSDCSGGAGIQADLKTFTVHGVYGMSVITALTAQNTCGVRKIADTPVEMVEAQLQAVFEDIFPDAVKTGMMSSAKIIRIVAEGLKYYKAKNIVMDPVMVSTSGHSLLAEDARQALVRELMPLATVITPNLPEAEKLCGFPVESKEDMLRAAKYLAGQLPGVVLIKGGHIETDSDDLLYTEGQPVWLRGEHIKNPNTHGTGCTLSSAIASNLAKGMQMAQAVALAKEYITKAIAAGLKLGRGRGPLNHMIEKKEEM